MTARAALLVAGLVVVVLVGVARPAAGHASLASTTPADGTAAAPIESRGPMRSTLSARRVATVAAALLALLVVTAAPALAHVTVRADTAAPEAYAVYTVRVPNESDTASTTMVEVQMPEGFTASRYEPVPGWELSIADGVLPAVQTHDDGEVASWTGPEDADQPAPVVTIGGGGEAADDGGTGAVPWVALALGAIGAAAGGLALFRRA